jgi:hypothetical protein
MSLRKLAKQKLKRAFAGLGWSPRHEKNSEPIKTFIRQPTNRFTNDQHVDALGVPPFAACLGQPDGTADSLSSIFDTVLSMKARAYGPRRYDSNAFPTGHGRSSAIHPDDTHRSSTLDSVTAVYHGHTPPASTYGHEVGLEDIEEERASIPEQSGEETQGDSSDWQSLSPTHYPAVRVVPASKRSNCCHHVCTKRSKPKLKVQIPRHSSSKLPRKPRQPGRRPTWNDVESTFVSCHVNNQCL